MSEIALPLAKNIFEAYLSYIRRFNDFTRLAPLYFSQRNWQATQQNHRQRLRLYKDTLLPLAKDLQEKLGTDTTNRTVWSLIRNKYQEMISSRPDAELAQTFFNSIF
ncbi:MAG TPA: hypothetical protein DCR24_10950 [Bacillus bacterium]|nr:hypothetical protein [Bacillus sp. (in: firmicutes)]